jgi:hypothetical protein
VLLWNDKKTAGSCALTSGIVLAAGIVTGGRKVAEWDLSDARGFPAYLL